VLDLSDFGDFGVPIRVLAENALAKEAIMTSDEGHNIKGRQQSTALAITGEANENGGCGVDL
jgi:hypothetical protein